MRTRRVRAIALLGALVGASLLFTQPTASAGPSNDSPYKGFASGTALHANVLETGVDGVNLVNGEIAFSGSATNSKGFTGSIINEFEQAIVPSTLAEDGSSTAGKKGFGRGDGAEVGVGTSVPSDPDDSLLTLAGATEAVAPPPTALLTDLLGPTTIDPILYASALRGEAQAIWNDNACIFGQPIGYGRGYAADASLINTGDAPAENEPFADPLIGTNDPALERGVSDSKSFSYLISNADGTFGLVSEVRMIVAPVRVGPLGTTIELLGEWILRATATGKPGGAKVEYAPAGGVSPSTPVIRVLDDAGVPTDILTFQDLLGDTGLVIPTNPLLEVAVGEDPRAIDPTSAIDAEAPAIEAADGTKAEGAVDVVRLGLLPELVDPIFNAFDVRLGHMEVSAEVPVGGIKCGIPLRKVAEPNPAQPGKPFTWTIFFPADANALLGIACEFTNIKVVDKITVLRGTPKFKVTGTDPAGATITPANGEGGVGKTVTVAWDLGTRVYKPGDPPIQLKILGNIPADTGAGLIREEITATAKPVNCTGGTGGEQLVGRLNLTSPNSTFTGTLIFDIPDVNQGGELAATGRETAGFAVLGLLTLMGAYGLHRFRRRIAPSSG